MNDETTATAEPTEASSALAAIAANGRSRRGRKPNVYITADGERLLGLRKRKDGRWDSYRVTFSAASEAEAIRKHKELTGQETAGETFARNNAKHQISMSLDQWWAYAAKEILAKPQWVAEKTGIEWIAYGKQLKAPKPLPTFQEIEDCWKNFYAKNAEQKRKVLAAWADFKTTANVAGIADITPEVVIAYRDAVYARNLTGKSQQNLFTRIRRLFSFAKSRAIAVDELSKVLEYLSLLTPSESTVSLDPHPISREDWDKLHTAAEGDNRAMVLLMLNCGMYVQEAINLRWDDIKEGKYIIAHRKKTGKCLRIAVLWKETLDALAKVEKRGEYIFIGEHGLPLGIKGAESRFRTLREKAGVAHVCGSHVRDGAATSATECTADQRLVSLLLGHRSGIRDHYAKRVPAMVAPACDAVYKAYFGPREQ